MRWVKIGTQIGDHPRFLEAGSLARDLWAWGMVYSGDHELDGEIPMAAVMNSPWGHGSKANVKLADTLVRLGLWERTDPGYRICRWAEQGNETKATLTKKRVDALARKGPRATKGSRELSANESRTNAKGSTSMSLSPSGYGSGSQIASWWDGACDATAMAVGGEVGDRPARWAEYIASRERKGWQVGHGDAVGWLSTVVRSERAKAATAPKPRGAEITKQGYDPDAPWLKLPEVG